MRLAILLIISENSFGQIRMRKSLTDSNFIKIPLRLPKLEVVSQKVKGNQIIVQAQSVLAWANCPICLNRSEKLIKDDRVRVVRDLNALQFQVFLHLRQRRFFCSVCQRRFRERFEFVADKARLTRRMQAFLLKQSRSNSLLKTAQNNCVSYRQMAYLCFAKGTNLALLCRDKRLPKRIGIDEFALRKGHIYASVISNQEKAEICGIGAGRTTETVTNLLGSDQKRLRRVRQVTLDMWKPFHRAVKKLLPTAERVIDRFHVERYFTKAVDRSRKRLAKEHPDWAKTLKKHRSLWVKHESDLDADERQIRSEMFQNLPELKRVVVIYQALRSWYQTPKEHSSAVQKLEILLRILKLSKIEELLDLAKMLENWKQEIANYFLSYATNGRSEGINTKIKLIKRASFGRLTFPHLRARIFLDFFHPT